MKNCLASFLGILAFATFSSYLHAQEYSSLMEYNEFDANIGVQQVSRSCPPWVGPTPQELAPGVIALEHSRTKVHLSITSCTKNELSIIPLNIPLKCSYTDSRLGRGSPLWSFPPMLSHLVPWQTGVCFGQAVFSPSSRKGLPLMPLSSPAFVPITVKRSTCGWWEGWFFRYRSYAWGFCICQGHIPGAVCHHDPKPRPHNSSSRL